MIYGAARLFPVSGPALSRGAIRVSDGRIAGAGDLRELRSRHPGDRVYDRPDCVILPGFVNAHTHLEYSLFRHLARPSSFRTWIRRLVAESLLRRRFWSHEHWVDAAVRGARKALATGTTTVGDIVSFDASPIAAHRTGLRMRAYLEAVALRDDTCAAAVEAIARKLSDPLLDGSLVRPGIAPHSVYTLSPGCLRLLAGLLSATGLPSAVHVAESPAERELLSGRGPLADHIDRWGLPFRGKTRSFLGYLADAGLLTERTMLVHGTHLDDGDIKAATAAGAVMAACVRSNRMLRCGTPPLARWEEAGLEYVYGSDSLASTPDLDLLAETRASLTSSSDPRKVIRRLTLGGAEALGFDDVTGSLEEGKDADFIFLRVPDAGGCDEKRILADDVAVAATYVAGRRVYCRRTGATARL